MSLLLTQEPPLSENVHGGEEWGFIKLTLHAAEIRGHKVLYSPLVIDRSIIP